MEKMDLLIPELEDLIVVDETWVTTSLCIIMEKMDLLIPELEDLIAVDETWVTTSLCIIMEKMDLLIPELEDLIAVDETWVTTSLFIIMEKMDLLIPELEDLIAVGETWEEAEWLQKLLYDTAATDFAPISSTAPSATPASATQRKQGAAEMPSVGVPTDLYTQEYSSPALEPEVREVHYASTVPWLFVQNTVTNASQCPLKKALESAYRNISHRAGGGGKHQLHESVRDPTTCEVGTPSPRQTYLFR